jgi:hypothetical protein
MKSRALWAAVSAAVGATLLALAFRGYGAFGPFWLLQALPGCN